MGGDDEAPTPGLRLSLTNFVLDNGGVFIAATTVAAYISFPYLAEAIIPFEFATLPRDTVRRCKLDPSLKAPGFKF